MNRENCSQFQATDNLMFISQDKCTVNFIVYIVWMLLLALIKSIQAVASFVDWRKRYAKVSKNSGRKPVVPILVAIQAVSEILYLCLTATNILNAENGGAFALYCWLYFVFCCYSFILIRQFINLGKRLIPIAKATPEELNSQKYDDLSRANFVLNLLMFSYVVNTILEVLFGVVVNLSLFPRSYQTWLRIASYFQVRLYFFIDLHDRLTSSHVKWFQFASFCSMVFFQFERLINAVKYGFEKPHKKEVVKAIRKMRTTQVALCFNILGGSILTLLVATEAIQYTYIVNLLTITFESVGAVSTFFLGKRRKSQHRVAGSADNKGKVEDTMMAHPNNLKDSTTHNS